MNLEHALAAARLALAFGSIERATLHPDGRRETDATHTVMLILVVAELAREEGVDVEAAIQFAAVHDLVEAHAGDVNTAGGLSEDERAAKAEREAAAIERIRRELGPDSWAIEWIDRYERQEEPAARLVRYADKITPKLTHALNGGLALEAIGMDPEAARDAHIRQGAWFAAANPRFVVTRRLFDAAHEAAVHAYQARLAGEWVTCWRCRTPYADNLAEDNVEQRCPTCGASQHECEFCDASGAEQCIKCGSWCCPKCWDEHAEEVGDHG